MDRMGVDSLDELSQRVNHRSARLTLPRRLGSALLVGTLGAGGLLFLSSIRGDAGYCPDPQDHSRQNWHASGFIPDYLRLRLEIPFTDVHTAWSDGATINVCNIGSTGGNPNTPPYVPPAPTCDTKTITIIDGKRSVQQTHYPAATTVHRQLVK